MQHWHLLYTKPGKETLVSAQLEDRDIEVYLPMLQVDRGYRRGIRTEPFFPHYLFLNVDLQSQKATDIRWMPGVRSLVHFDEKPAVVPDEIINALQERLQPLEEKVIKKAAYHFKPGQEVQITSGPFQGFQAIFQRGLSGSERAEVLLKFLNGWNRARVEVGLLEPVLHN